MESEIEIKFNLKDINNVIKKEIDTENIEGEVTQECDWLKFIKLNQYITIPEEERNLIINNHDTQKNYSRLKKISNENLIFFFIGTKIFFINKTNLPKFYKKEKKTTYDDFLIIDFSSEIKDIQITDSILYKKNGEKLKEPQKFILISIKNKILIFECEIFVAILNKITNNNNEFNFTNLIENNCYNILLDNDKDKAIDLFSLKDVIILQEQNSQKFFFVYLGFDNKNNEINNDVNLLFDEEKNKKGNFIYRIKIFFF
jgi:hypothetical protein